MARDNQIKEIIIHEPENGSDETYANFLISILENCTRKMSTDEKKQYIHNVIAPFKDL